MLLFLALFLCEPFRTLSLTACSKFLPAFYNILSTKVATLKKKKSSYRIGSVLVCHLHSRHHHGGRDDKGTERRLHLLQLRRCHERGARLRLRQHPRRRERPQRSHGQVQRLREERRTHHRRHHTRHRHNHEQVHLL